MTNYDHSATAQTRAAISLAVKASDQFPLTRPYSTLSQASKALLDSVQAGLSESAGKRVGMTQAMAVVLALTADMYGGDAPALETAKPAPAPSKAVAQ